MGSRFVQAVYRVVLFSLLLIGFLNMIFLHFQFVLLLSSKYPSLHQVPSVSLIPLSIPCPSIFRLPLSSTSPYLLPPIVFTYLNSPISSSHFPTILYLSLLFLFFRILLFFSILKFFTTLLILSWWFSPARFYPRRLIGRQFLLSLFWSLSGSASPLLQKAWLVVKISLLRPPFGLIIDHFLFFLNENFYLNFCYIQLN